MAESLRDKIDKGLQKYYNDLGRNDYMDDMTNRGKFEIFVADGEIDIEEELEESDIDECTLLDFDDDFPFENANIKDENAQKQEMLRIIKYIRDNGSYPVTKNEHQPKKKKQIQPLTLETVNMHDEDINSTDAVQRYATQMNLNIQANASLTYFLAVSGKCNYPFITYIVDSFTHDNAKHHHQTQGKTLTISEWADSIPFMKALKTKAKYQATETKLEQAMVDYSKRVMQRLNFAPSIKIDDNLNSICKYITAVAQYIGNLIDAQIAIPPFQVDLSFAVNVKSAYLDSKNDDDDDDEEDDSKNNKTVNIDNVIEDLRRYTPVTFERDTTTDDKLLIFRNISLGSKEFRTKLSQYNNKHKDEDMKIEYDGKSYPQYTRFAIFVDRRNHENNENSQNKIVLYLYPNDCNKIEKDHVPEIGFKLLKQCIIPKQPTIQPENNMHITSETDVNGKLITFMFNIEQEDEIRCYIVWNQGTMRFHGEDMVQVLPWLFEKNSENIEFIKTSHELQKTFNEKIKDKNYNTFYKALRKQYID